MGASQSTQTIIILVHKKVVKSSSKNYTYAHCVFAAYDCTSVLHLKDRRLTDQQFSLLQIWRFRCVYIALAFPGLNI